MRGLGSVLLLAVAVVGASACRGSLEVPDASTTVIVSDASTRDVIAALDASARDAIIALDGFALDLGSDRLVPVGIPKADPDAGTCVPGTSGLAISQGLVCFGSDPAPYQLYLEPRDGGVAPGQCPSTRDFKPFTGGESCGYVSCGPLLGSAVTDLLDGGAVEGDAGTDCCYFVAYVCGV